MGEDDHDNDNENDNNGDDAEDLIHGESKSPLGNRRVCLPFYLKS